ncbi:copper-binding protein [Salipaludibacillus keqinensis]|uniref:Copper-binding protein n=1 Tax=Salipaludibacillus keqinensis TaxID=2045207 RepID=A0A323TEI6_9BACI|nr:cupredoxin domain-containing protein [Salipaludibacillus keqinensis]PYZ93016.1 copper-binding protein [Salipaludibacillus keqinensis]
MTTFIIIVVSLLSIILITSFTTSFIQRKRSAVMTGMMAAMVIGMCIGLTIGVLLGSLFQGDLFTSTIISMAIGMFAGILVGIPFNALSVLDGMLAGIMGGMMGAMLGEMISPADAILLVKILLTISICSTIIILLFLLQTNRKEENANFKWMIRPLATFVVLFLLLGSIAQINVNSDNHNQSHHTPDINNPDNQLKIEVTGFEYTPNEISVTKSESTELKLVNNDDIEHDLEIIDFPFETLNTEPVIENHTNHSHNSALHIHSKPHSKNSISFKATQKGTYLFYCTIPGHKERGMVGTIIVN